MKYISTRGTAQSCGFSDALLTGLATDGGLYVPDAWPRITAETLRDCAGKPYATVAAALMAPFTAPDMDGAALQALCDNSAAPFRHPAVAPLVQVSERLWIMELFHGPTLAFKDVALQLLGRLFDRVLAARNSRITVVGATSGDTGSAAIEACRDRENVDIFILHPHGRVSDVQRRQMTTVQSGNVHNIALEGSFDDCQTLVKALFNDADTRAALNLSAINSINWARILAQMVYYVTAAVALGSPYRKVRFAVPTGNFGNVYAAYAAGRCGLPLDRLVIGTNRNDILTRYYETGTMATETVQPSLSPSMDIQISSNFERLVFDLLRQEADQPAATVQDLMQTFRTTGTMTPPTPLHTAFRQRFTCTRCDDEQTLETIRTLYGKTGYVVDPHTAVGLHAAQQSLANDDDPAVPVVALACAHPAKFSRAVEKAIGHCPPLPDHLADLMERDETVTVLPNDFDTVRQFVTERSRVGRAAA